MDSNHFYKKLGLFADHCPVQLLTWLQRLPIHLSSSYLIINFTPPSVNSQPLVPDKCHRRCWQPAARFRGKGNHLWSERVVTVWIITAGIPAAAVIVVIDDAAAVVASSCWWWLVAVTVEGEKTGTPFLLAGSRVRLAFLEHAFFDVWWITWAAAWLDRVIDNECGTLDDDDEDNDDEKRRGGGQEVSRSWSALAEKSRITACVPIPKTALTTDHLLWVTTMTYFYEVLMMNLKLAFIRWLPDAFAVKVEGK